MVEITEVGRGAKNARQKHKTIPGEARESKNFVHGSFEENSWDRCELRGYLKRAFKGRDAVSGRLDVKSLIEHRLDDGTRTRLFISDDSLMSFSTDDDDDPVVIAGGLDNAGQYDMCQGFDRVYLAYDGDANYAFSLTNDMFVLTPGTRPTDPLVLSEAGLSLGFGTGVFEYTYTLYSSTEGWETRPRATTNTINKASENLGVSIADPTDPGIGGIYDRYRYYRRLQGENAWYLLGDSAAGFSDTVTEDELTDAALSEIHDNETGLEDYELPPAFTSVTFYKGRIFGAVGDTVWWSKVGLPFLFRINEIGRKQIGDDGDPIVAVRVVNESLVVFKRHSIWIMNGEAEEENFVFFPASRRVGLFAMKAFTLVPGGCMFLANDKFVYFFNLSQDTLMTPINTGYVLSADWTEDAYKFCAGYDPVKRRAYFTLGDEGGTHTVSLEGFAWSEAEHLEIQPRSYAEFHNANAECKLYFGSTEGWIYETETSTGADGVNSGTKSGRVDTGTSTTVFTVIGGGLQTAGDGLAGLPVSVEIDGEIETRKIASNTASQITADTAFSATPQHYSRVWIGGMEALLWLSPIRVSSDQARIDKLFYYMNPQSETWKFGATVDSETDRTSYKETTPAESVCFSAKRRCTSISPFISAFGTDLEMDFGGLEFEPTPVKGRR